MGQFEEHFAELEFGNFRTFLALNSLKNKKHTLMYARWSIRYWKRFCKFVKFELYSQIGMIECHGSFSLKRKYLAMLTSGQCKVSEDSLSNWRSCYLLRGNTLLRLSCSLLANPMCPSIRARIRAPVEILKFWEPDKIHTWIPKICVCFSEL